MRFFFNFYCEKFFKYFLKSQENSITNMEIPIPWNDAIKMSVKGFPALIRSQFLGLTITDL